MNRWTFIGAAAVLLGITLVINVWYAIRCHDGLSPWPIGNSFEEANVLRAAERYAREGFTADWGLPHHTYGDRYPDEGNKRLGKMRRPGANASPPPVPRPRPGDPIYHGYPPGCEWVVGLHAVFLGNEHVTPFRVFPIALRLLACVAFLVGMARAFGPGRALAVYLACLLAPMFTSYTHGLYYEGYAITLLLFQVTLVMGAMSRAGRAGPWNLAALFLLGFLQGWISWDFCFLVAFAPVPIALVSAPAGSPIPWRNVLAQCVASGAGFTAAHILHFTESALYLGGVGPAIQEYTFRSNQQYEVADILEGLSRVGRWRVGLRRYLGDYIGPDHFGRAGRLAVYGVVAILVLRRAEFGLGRWRVDARFARPGARELAAIAVALVIGLTWLFARPYHAVNHYFIMVRQLFLFYLTCCLVIARATEAFARGPVDDDTVAAPPAGRSARDIEPERSGRVASGFPTPVHRPSEAAHP